MQCYMTERFDTLKGLFGCYNAVFVIGVGQELTAIGQVLLCELTQQPAGS